MSSKLTQNLTELVTVDTANDKIPIVDSSDPSELKYTVPDNIAPSATATVAGKVELATTAETETGTDATRAVTPDGLHDMTSLAGAAWFLDEDTMVSDSAVKVPSQQSVKAYVDTEISSLSLVPSDWNSYSAVVPTLASATKDKYTLTFAGVDLTSIISVGKRVKLTQTDGSNTQSLDLESGSSQYASKTDSASLSITGAITIEAWVKLESLSGVGQCVAGKWYQDANLKSYVFYVNSDNRTIRFDYSGDSSNESGLTSGNCISQADIGRWIHLAVVCVPSTKTITFYKNGEQVSTGTASGVQTSIADNTSTFAVGARDVQGTPDTFFDGKICEVKLWSTNRTQAQIQGDMFHNLAGNESNLAGYWKLDNSYSDATANANNLTASGSPVFSADVPLKLTNNVKYGIVTSISFSTDTSMQVMMGSEYGVDNGTISAFNYSLTESPVGFPVYMNYHSEGPTGCSISSRFTTYGRTVDVVIWGAATGAMDWSSMPSLPIAVSANTNGFDADSSAHGVGGYLDSGTVNNVDGLSPTVGPNDTTVRIVGSDTSSIVSATSPITWAVNDTWYLHFTYEF